MKVDPQKNKQRYFNWIEKIKGRIPDISKASSDIILKYILDMERGLNISKSSIKGARSYARLNNIRQRMVFIVKEFEERFNIKDIRVISEEQIFVFFNDMRNGKIQKKQGGIYKSVADYVKVFKSFWHWHIKVEKKKGSKIIDIAEDLDTSREKPKWVYLTEEQIKQLCDNAKYNYRMIIMFLYDSGVRSPSELINIKTSDFHKDFKEVEVRDEISKTFGRRIKLMFCSSMIKEYIKIMGIGPDDRVFDIKPTSVNKYLQRLAKKVLGDKMSLAGKKYSELTMYHFRHCSCCYWLPRYKSESSLKYRFGWKESDKIHYYSEFLGMVDTISEEDMLVDVTKTEIEQRLLKSENEKEVLLERVGMLEGQMKEILEFVKKGELVVSLN
ncbi:tyrosine-type recombinase/integrase [archaeon]|jgi:integrase|nr:tyrosine-type recombinase/integrase [archaeon]MBT7025403.1 tyrosine-type recombinase/integrase [archaeon]MBT7239253.1 tyrosine-type recombinase/integrase [archaeon]MBT7568174.1 tyrosine-type recombinase/integrase [archaeon]